MLDFLFKRKTVRGEVTSWSQKDEEELKDITIPEERQKELIDRINRGHKILSSF